MRFLKFVIVAAALICVSCKGQSKRAEAPRKVKCHSAVVVDQSVETNTFAGRVVASADLNLGFRVAGIIDKIVASQGAMVRKGEVIAVLDSRDYELQLAATQAEYDAIKAEVDRVVELYAQQSVSANDYDKATNGLRAITTKLKAHKNCVADCKLRAPMDCYITKVNFGRGEAVAAGTPIVSVISTGAPQVTIDIPVKNYLQHSKMIAATATIENLDNKQFNLRAKGVSPKGNNNQLYNLIFDIVPTKGAKYPAVGMSATVEVSYNLGGDSLIEIPLSAIMQRAGHSSVWVVKSGSVQTREIEVVRVKSDGTAQIRGDVSDGDMVVVAGINTLIEGEEVDILPLASASNVGALK